jgi:hypothetical protein
LRSSVRRDAAERHMNVHTLPVDVLRRITDF